MKKLILTVVLLFSAQFALADFAADLGNAAVGADVSALVQAAITNGESAESIATALSNAGISSDLAVAMLNQASYPSGTTHPGLGSIVNSVIAGFGLTGDAASGLVSRSATFPARTGTTPLTVTITGRSSGVGGGGGGGGGISVSTS